MKKQKRISKKVALLAVAVLLVLGCLAIPATPASAHHYDGWSQYYCIKHRPSNTAVNHSWPSALGPGFVQYWCHAASLSSGASWQYWVNVQPPYSANSWRPYDYQSCSVVLCGTNGH